MLNITSLSLSSGRCCGVLSIWSALAEDGAVVVDGLIDATTVDRLLADFRPHLDAAPYCNTGPNEVSNAFFGHQTKRLHGLLARSSSFAEVLQHPLLLEMAKTFVGPNSRDLRLDDPRRSGAGPAPRPDVRQRPPGRGPAGRSADPPTERNSPGSFRLAGP